MPPSSATCPCSLSFSLCSSSRRVFSACSPVSTHNPHSLRFSAGCNKAVLTAHTYGYGWLNANRITSAHQKVQAQGVPWNASARQATADKCADRILKRCCICCTCAAWPTVATKSVSTHGTCVPAHRPASWCCSSAVSVRTTGSDVPLPPFPGSAGHNNSRMATACSCLIP